VARLMDGPEYGASVRSVYDLYASYDDRGISTQGLCKFAQDAGLVVHHLSCTDLTLASVGAIFLEAVPPCAEGARLNYAHFLHALVKLAQRTFPQESDAQLSHAVVWLLRDHLLPLAEQIQLGAPIGAAPSPDTSVRMRELVEEFSEKLRLVFAHYVTGGERTLRLADLSHVATDFRIVPHFVTPLEATELFEKVTGSSDTAATFDDFVLWLASAAQLGFSKPPRIAEYGNLTPLCRVKELCLVILAAPLFARIERASRFQLATAAEEQLPIEVRLQAYVEQAGLAADMSRIFSYYCQESSGQGPQDTMRASSWAKFLRECNVLDFRVGYEHIELLFLSAVGGRTKGAKPRMTLPQFYVGIAELARRKLPEEEPLSGGCTILRQYILPNARRVEPPLSVDWAKMPEVWQLFLENNTLLHLVFGYYAQKGTGVYVPPTSNTGMSLQDGQRGERDPLEFVHRISFAEFHCFAKDFTLYTTISHVQLNDKFCAVLSSRTAPATNTREDLSFDEFAALLLDCAVHPAELSTIAPALATRRVQALLDEIKTSESLKAVELWRQCHRPTKPDLKPGAGSPKESKVKVVVAAASHPALAPHVEGLHSPVGHAF